MDREHIIELGEISTLDKGKHNMQGVPLPYNFGDVLHFDIGYGYKQGLDGIRYSLLFVDRATRYDLIYPLKNLTSNLVAAAKQLVADIGFAPKKAIADFNMKLIGGEMKAFFTEKGATIEAAPPRHQRQNGLVERHWRTL
eukprot:10058196-Ditylum_brightwellii.AAC.1